MGPRRARTLAATLVIATACTGADDDTVTAVPPSPIQAPSEEADAAPSTTADTTPTSTTIALGPSQETLDGVSVIFEPVVDADHPTAVATRPDDDALYWTEVAGTVWAQEPGGERRVVLDLTDRTEATAEQGLLGLDFSPDGRLLYASFTDLDGHSRLVEYAMADGVADSGTWRDVMTVEQPEPVHNGGHVVVGPDGLLWWSIGDGGERWDPDRNAQSLDSLLGKLLRIDPRPTADAAYGVPDDNPFVGVDGARPEIWALGLRNPWRFSVDHPTGDVWIGDVGQYAIEEIDLVPASAAGANLGWPHLEGTAPVQGRSAPPDVVGPIVEYPHEGGRCAVTGGYVYRGTAIPGLAGAYLYADLCDQQVRVLSQRDGAVVAERWLGVQSPQIVSIQPDADGEPLVVSMVDGIQRIVPADR
jgi:glucose/arabinose dehydrogenase